MGYPVFASGDVLTAADMNAVGLWLVKTQTLSGTSVQIDNCFTSDYRSYRIVFSGLTSSTIDFLTARLVAGTTPNQTPNYYWSNLQVTTAGAVSGFGGAANTFWNTGLPAFTNAGGGVIDIHNPQLTASTVFSSQGIDTRTDGAPHRTGSGSFSATTSFQGLWISTINGGYTLGGSVRVYGYRN